MGEVVQGIDERWLDRAADRDPLRHAYAVWDRVHEADRVRFLSYREGRETVAYLVLWLGTLGLPVVHWVGPTDWPGPLLDALPARPFIAVVPPELTEPVRQRRGPIESTEVELRQLADGAPVGSPTAEVRRLTRRDATALAEFAHRESGPLREAYRGIDPERLPVVGHFQGDRLIAVAKATVTLPRVWILSGIIVEAEHRGRGLGEAVTTALIREALQGGARPALYVRRDNQPAVRLYERLGFRIVERRVWIDAGGARLP